MPKKTVKINAKMTSGWDVELKARHHSLKIDQPKPTSADVAPNPLEFFFFSLGACFCTVGKIIAAERNIDLKAIDVKVEGDINTDFLQGKSFEGRAGFTAIRVSAMIDADISDSEKLDFAKDIERRCPIVDNILNDSMIELIIIS
jgi:uncharacterized OsmC-like protein